ncbi:MAG: branched-chain amino acid ABC transporter permease [Actinomycetales bacterium]
MLWLQYIIDSIGTGALYSLMTLGLALVFSVMGLMNFAYGQLVMIGGFSMILLRSQPWWVLILGTILAVVVVSLLMERLAFRPVRMATAMTMLITSFALAQFLQQSARVAFGANPRPLEQFSGLSEQSEFAGLRISRLSMLTVVVTIVVLISLAVLLRRTTIGMKLRASTEDVTMAALVGIKSNRVIASAFVISGVIAAIVAMLFFSSRTNVSWSSGESIVLIAFVGAVIGGLGSMVGAALGGFLMGFVYTMLNALLPTDLRVFADAFLYTIVIIVLLVRPAGLVAAKGVRV